MNRRNYSFVVLGLVGVGLFALQPPPAAGAADWPSPDEVAQWERDCASSPTGEALAAIVEEVRPLVERFSGRAFEQIPLVQLAKPSEIAAELEAEWGRMLRAAAPHTDEFERTFEVKASVATVLPTVPARFFADRNAILVNDRTLCMLRKAWDKYRADSAFDAQALLKVAIARELARALQEQHADMSARLLAAKSNEQLAACWAVSESQARWVQRAVAAELKADSESDLLNDLFRTASLTLDERQHGHVRAFYFKDRSLLFEAGDQFVQKHAENGGAARLWTILESPPRSDRDIRHPENWNPQLPQALTPSMAFDELAGQFRRDGLNVNRKAFEEFEAFTLLGMVGKNAPVDDARDRAAFKIRDGEVLLAQTPDGKLRRSALIVRMNDEESAKEFCRVRVSRTTEKLAPLAQGPDKGRFEQRPLALDAFAKADSLRLTLQSSSGESGIVVVCGIRGRLYVEVSEATAGSEPPAVPFGLDSISNNLPALAID